MKIKEIPEGGQQAQAVERFVNAGAIIVRDTNLVKNEGDINLSDVVTARQFIQTISPVTIENYRTHAHLQLTAKVARTFGEKLQEVKPDDFQNLNLDELEILGLFHDLGRLITHRFYRNEVLERLILRKIGICNGIIQKNPAVSIFFDKDPNNEKQVQETFDNLSQEARIVILADLCGKRTDTGDILSFENVMKYHQKSRRDYKSETGLETTWPSEKTLKLETVDFSAKIYEKIYEWIRQEGVDPEEVRRDIIKQERECPVKAVIFDVGNVLIPNPDPKIIEGVLKTFSIDRSQFEANWIPLVHQFQTGELTAEEFWHAFSSRLGKNLPSGYGRLLTDPLSVNVDPKLTALIAELRRKGFILSTLSDTVVPHTEKLQSAGFYNLFDVSVSSYEIGTRKDKNEAFKIAALKLWLPPQACLFIDDKPEYVKNAETTGMKAIAFTTPDQLINDLQNYLG